MLSGCVGYQEVQALPGWEKIYSPDRPQALEVPEGRVVPKLVPWRHLKISAGPGQRNPMEILGYCGSLLQSTSCDKNN